MTPGRIKKQLESARGLIAQKLPVACITHTFVLQIPTHPHVLAVATKELFGGCHDTHNDDFRHNDTQHNGLICDPPHKSTLLSTECRYAERRVFIVLVYVILNVVMLSAEYRAFIWWGVIRLICTKSTGDYKCILLA